MTDNNLPETPEVEPLTRTQVLVAMGVTAAILLAIAKLWQNFGHVAILPVKPELEAIAWGIGVGIGITIASTFVYRIWPSYRHSADVYLELVLRPLLWPDLIWLGLLPGLSEELLFRGVILSAFGLNITALIISSVCFGVLHINGKNQWPYMIWASFVGGILGASALVTGNLLVPIVAHILTNIISSSVWKLEHKSPQ